MPEFTIRYFFGDDAEAGGAGGSYVSEGLDAPTMDDAARVVQERMNLPIFGIDSDGYGRVIVNRDRVRFCSILPAQTPLQSATLAQRVAAAHESARDVNAERAATAARDVSQERERF